MMCGTKRLDPFFILHEASDVLNKDIMGVLSDNFTAAFFVIFIVTVFAPDIEGIQNKVICLLYCIVLSNVFTPTRKTLDF